MGTRTKTVSVCDQCGSESDLSLQDCLICEMSLCSRCLPSSWSAPLPLSNLWIDVCKKCLSCDDVQEVLTVVEADWRARQSEWKARFSSLPSRKHRTWEEQDALLKKQLGLDSKEVES